MSTLGRAILKRNGEEEEDEEAEENSVNANFPL